MTWSNNKKIPVNYACAGTLSARLPYMKNEFAGSFRLDSIALFLIPSIIALSRRMLVEFIMDLIMQNIFLHD